MKRQPSSGLAEKRRILQLETLNDLAVALHAHRPEQELVDEVLERVCAVLDPAAAVVVTRDAYGDPRAISGVGWTGGPPDAGSLFSEPVWNEILASGQTIALSAGEFVGRPFEAMVATPIVYRGVFLGYLALLDKETRGGPGEDVAGSGFPAGDRRFLEAVSALAGVALDGARQFESLRVQKDRLEEENRVLKELFTADLEDRRIIAKAPAMRRALEMAERVAPRGVSVVIRGESGTGKELVAKLLHLRSGRSGPMVVVDCAAVPETLLESELFGIEEGVATGVSARLGKFELAHEGTLFLDEIGDIRPEVQVKLLRALQEREVVRIGARAPIPTDVRLVAATHRDLEQLVRDGTFREDLYYRLKGVEIHLPPLRERREDIPHLVRHVVENFCRREGIPVLRVHPDALALLLAYDFPGNVRELQNMMEAAVSLADEEVGAEVVRPLLGGTAGSGPQALELGAVERQHIGKVLKLTGGNKSSAARILGIDRRTLQRKGF
ncbi:MAG: sigma 54-interacting transcriptional regulator [Acidobacteria bacterium]|nr:sigma 54-interacting transcriptional regulator [Acidobacteriota bacterium]